jgi:transcriptional regulator with XRE-family HTH domain
MSSENITETVTTILGVPERLRALQEGFVGTQTRFLKEIGVRLPQWRRYTKGERLPEEAVLRRITRATNVSLHWLLTGEADRPDPLRAALAPHRCEFLTFAAVCAARKATRVVIVALAEGDRERPDQGPDWAEEIMTRAATWRDGQGK